MMRCWAWFLPLAVLTFAGALWAFRWGWIAATITETDVINRSAAEYLLKAGTSARVTDCVARPGQLPGVWIVVTCENAVTGRYDFAVDRLGRRVQPATLGTATTGPAT